MIFKPLREETATCPYAHILKAMLVLNGSYISLCPGTHPLAYPIHLSGWILAPKLNFKLGAERKPEPFFTCIPSNLNMEKKRASETPFPQDERVPLFPLPLPLFSISFPARQSSTTRHIKSTVSTTLHYDIYHHPFQYLISSVA